MYNCRMQAFKPPRKNFICQSGGPREIQLPTVKPILDVRMLMRALAASCVIASSSSGPSPLPSCPLPSGPG